MGILPAEVLDKGLAHIESLEAVEDSLLTKDSIAPSFPLCLGAVPDQRIQSE